MAPQNHESDWHQSIVRNIENKLYKIQVCIILSIILTKFQIFWHKVDALIVMWLNREINWFPILRRYEINSGELVEIHLSGGNQHSITLKEVTCQHQTRFQQQINKNTIYSTENETPTWQLITAECNHCTKTNLHFQSRKVKDLICKWVIKLEVQRVDHLQLIYDLNNRWVRKLGL